MKKYTLLFLLLTSSYGLIRAQTPNQQIPFSHSFYQKLNQSVYDPHTRFHSAIKGYFLDDSLLQSSYKKLMHVGIDTLIKRSWIRRKVTQEHLLQYKNKEYVVYANFLPDMIVGKELHAGTNTWLNTRGFEVGGAIGKQFSFYFNGFENQGVFANYYTDFIDKNNVIPGQGGDSIKLDPKIKDWAYSSALLSYTPSKYLNLALGYDKNFIGDGYRSMLLSDVASNYSFLRVRASLGNVQYQTIFAYMADPGARTLTSDRRLGVRRKWAAMHYLDWNVSNRLSLGFFQAVTWADAEEEGGRGFDFNYIHPFVFLRPLESVHSLSPDKMRLGLNVKYEVLNHTALYGQFLLDEFRASEFFAGTGHWRNKYALQLGVKGSDLFNVKRLNYLAEFNTARPYTYSHFNRLSNYAHYNQPLAHPLGANFKELVGILNYSYQRLDFQAKLSTASYGLDVNGLNYGKNIFLSYDTRVADYGIKTGQGLDTKLNHTELTMAYLLNPNYNLRLELGGIFRTESNSQFNQKTNWVTFGIRSSFRNSYTDF